MSTPDVIDLATRIQRRRDFTAHLTGFVAGVVFLMVLHLTELGPTAQLLACVLTWATALSAQHFRHVLRGPVTRTDVDNEHAHLTQHL